MAPKKGSGIGSAPARPINSFFTPVNRTNATSTSAVTSAPAAPLNMIAAPAAQARAQKRVKFTSKTTPAETPDEAIFTGFIGQKLGVACDNRTRNLNKFVAAIDAGLRLEPGVKENYTPSKGRVKHVLDLSPHPNRLGVPRDFRLVPEMPYLTPATRVLEVDKQGTPTKTTVNQVWHLPVRDFSDPTSPTIIPFTLDPRGENPILTGAALRATGESKAHGGYPIPADCLPEGDMRI
ncbi:hypothetical protein D6D17_10093 [Aureobasidium pullulans]|nr:hypothetical protein D6D17_10093 [Aureobasidium pullulans]THX21016.1 hypothetical protein D6D12_10182 [Aureobasidium pullulans]THX25985.1 hypothetical protein D6D11_10341 [Aureobasidium pullulans]THX96346.1 hypothetical protein D6D08_00895 [Aureobasidium pullulans]THY49326.1 hypothetical protein D6C99_05160 [Aureobasidium pullulans]